MIGSKRESPACSELNSGLFYACLERGDVKGIFCGHDHGGIWRLPFVGGVYAPEQGFFPEYIDGVHVMNETTMIISRGLGNSIIPVRAFNRPEIVCVEMGQ